VDVENKYYNAKQMKAEQPEEAIEEFLGVPALEDEKGDWGFRGLKQAIKLEYRLGRYDAVSLRQHTQASQCGVSHRGTRVTLLRRGGAEC